MMILHAIQGHTAQRLSGRLHMLSGNPSARWATRWSSQKQTRFAGVLRMLACGFDLRNLPVQHIRPISALLPATNASFDAPASNGYAEFGNGIGLVGDESVVCWSHGGRKRRLRRA